jgi:hypothetical protein
MPARSYDRELCHACHGKRPVDLVIGGSLCTWSIGAPCIVGILPVRDGIQAVTVDDLILDSAE